MWAGTAARSLLTRWRPYIVPHAESGSCQVKSSQVKSSCSNFKHGRARRLLAPDRGFILIVFILNIAAPHLTNFGVFFGFHDPRLRFKARRGRHLADSHTEVPLRKDDTHNSRRNDLILALGKSRAYSMMESSWFFLKAYVTHAPRTHVLP